VWLDNLFDAFIEYIKNKNFILTPSDKILLFNSLNEINIINREEVFALCYSIIVKSKNEFLVFKELFDDFFANLYEDNPKNTYSESDGFIRNNSVLTSVLSSYKLNKYTYNSSVKAFILSDKNRLDRLIRLAISNLDEVTINNFGLSFNQVKSRLNINQLEEDIKIIKKEMLKKGASEAEVNEIINKIMQKLKNFKKNIRSTLKSRGDTMLSPSTNNTMLSPNNKTMLSPNNNTMLSPNNNTNLSSNNKTNLSKNNKNNKNNKKNEKNEKDLIILENSAKKLVEKLKKKKSKRYKKSQKGILDINKTLKKSISYNHLPLKRYYKKQKLKKRELIIMADVSDSVRKYSKTILYYIYTLNTFFKDIKTFTFAADIKEVSESFKNNLSLDLIMTNFLDQGGNSDYNSSFESLASKYQSYFNKNVIFIIIGDARNNYISADLKNLINIQKKVKDIIWLNPDNKLFWNTTDSNMAVYQRVVYKSFQVKTIKDIERFTEDILFR